jgi:hypothetical protein
MNDFQNTSQPESNVETDEYQSQSESIIKAARAAGNTWDFNGTELQKFVARGEASIETSVLDRGTREPSGTLLIHNFKWSKETPFATRAGAMVTQLRRTGRSSDQDIEAAHLVTINADLYKEIVIGGELKIPKGNSEFETRELSREDMIKHANLYPESASEAIETWIASATIDVISETEEGNLDYLFEADETVKVKWTLGNKDAPVAAAYIIFKTPPSEARKGFDQSVSKMKMKRLGDTNINEIRENFPKKIEYGLRYLLDIQGIAIGTEGRDFDKSSEMKKAFVALWNPLWFTEAVEAVQESFEIVSGKSKTN